MIMIKMLQSERVVRTAEGPDRKQGTEGGGRVSRCCAAALVTQYSSPAVDNMVHFLTTERVTPFDINQLAKLMFSTVQYLVFESAWKSSVENQQLKNLDFPNEDPRYEPGASQLLGLPPVSDPQFQARLHPLVLAQVKELGAQATLFMVANMANPTQTLWLMNHICSLWRDCKMQCRNKLLM